MSRKLPPPPKHTHTHTHILLHTVSCNLLHGVNTDAICSMQSVNSNMHMKTGVKRWYSDYDMRTLKCSKHNLFFCHFIYYKSRADRPGNETASPRWEAGVEQTEQSEERYNLLYGVRNVACRSKPLHESEYTIWGTLLVAQSVEALLYKSEGCGFDSRGCNWNFSST
jgi:hypothetical protein